MYQEFPLQDSPVFVIVMISLIGFMIVVTNLLSILIFCKIFAKAGYHWAFGLLIVVPIANLIMPFFLAFADWPVQKELRELRQRSGIAPGPGVSGYRQS
jgi:hypothetical protein